MVEMLRNHKTRKSNEKKGAWHNETKRKKQEKIRQASTDMEDREGRQNTKKERRTRDGKKRATKQAGFRNAEEENVKFILATYTNQAELTGAPVAKVGRVKSPTGTERGPIGGTAPRTRIYANRRSTDKLSILYLTVADKNSPIFFLLRNE